MKIAIIGAGNVGSALGERWNESGHHIIYGVRNIEDEKYTKLKEYAQLRTPTEAADQSDVIILATPWSSTKEIIQGLGTSVKNKVLVDCTNPLKPNLAGLEISGETSGAEQVAQWATGAKVVKSFNTTGYNIMSSPVINDQKTAMFIASDDEDARKTVAELAQDIGFEAIEMGALSSARLLEPFALMWISLAYKHGFGRDFGFSIQRRDSNSD